MKEIQENTEDKWDKLLKIRTGGRDDTKADEYYYPYEPTPYAVLERLSAAGYIGKKNLLIDYGCGKGRVGLFLSWQNRCKSIGVEFDERLFKRAEENRIGSVSGNRSCFMLTKAEEYEVPEDADRFYFFNPFSSEIMMRVLKKIIEQNYVNPKERYLFFYYPSSEYLNCLENEAGTEHVEDIDCTDLFENDDEREKISVWKIY
ncbi:MAG: SAM-dependent methyltransferase [Lachnospiraceae bacterium]|nr:SAM-dependent methyltransferase [Lachnospiraceae bacterium]